MGMLERLSDVRGTIEGKIVAIVLAILLLLPLASIRAFADDEEVADTQAAAEVTEVAEEPEAAPADEPADDVPAVEVEETEDPVVDPQPEEEAPAVTEDTDDADEGTVDAADEAVPTVVQDFLDAVKALEDFGAVDESNADVFAALGEKAMDAYEAVQNANLEEYEGVPEALAKLTEMMNALTGDEGTVVADEYGFWLHFDANGGTGAPDSMYDNNQYNGYFELPEATPTKPGYRFVEWRDAENDRTYKPLGSILTSKHETTLEAVWELKTPDNGYGSYTISLDLNGLESEAYPDGLPYTIIGVKWDAQIVRAVEETWENRINLPAETVSNGTVTLSRDGNSHRYIGTINPTICSFFDGAPTNTSEFDYRDHYRTEITLVFPESSLNIRGYELVAPAYSMLLQAPGSVSQGTFPIAFNYQAMPRLEVKWYDGNPNDFSSTLPIEDENGYPQGNISLGKLLQENNTDYYLGDTINASQDPTWFEAMNELSSMYNWSGWRDVVKGNTLYRIAQWVQVQSQYTVVWNDGNDQIVKTQIMTWDEISRINDADHPALDPREGYKFIEWINQGFDGMNYVFRAQWEEIVPDPVDPVDPENPDIPDNPNPVDPVIPVIPVVPDTPPAVETTQEAAEAAAPVVTLADVPALFTAVTDAVADFMDTPVLGEPEPIAEAIDDSENPLAGVQSDGEEGGLQAFTWGDYYIVIGVAAVAIFAGGALLRRYRINRMAAVAEEDSSNEK